MSRLGHDDNSSSSTTASSNAAYGDRVPHQNSLYDWSPANEADDEDELDHILQELRREQPNTHPEILRVLGRSQLDSERERIQSISSRLNSERAQPAESLRSTAILQSVRRHPRFSARSREYLQRYNADREAASLGRAGPHSESQSRFMSESARQMALQRQNDSRNSSMDRERRDMLARADRRNYLDHLTSNPTPTTSSLLEQTVRYLSRIRQSETVDDSLNQPLNLSWEVKQVEDFITDIGVIPPPAKTSWLEPGAVLSGCQHATSVAATAAPASGTGTAGEQSPALDSQHRPAWTTLAPPFAPHLRPWLASSYLPRSRTVQPPPENTIPQQDRWPVKVTIHEVDWEKMTLSATMEAYNVPSHPHALSTQQQQHYTRTSSITTYLEGEILDFDQHTLLTESFKSTPATDATYWRKLPPFASLSDEEVVRALTSRQFFKDVLGKDWVLMRWKERCFVKSLNRSTADPVLPPMNTTSTGNIPDGPIPSLHSHHISNPQTPYRLVRDPATNELQVEITYPPQSSNQDTRDGLQHATFDDSGCGLTISGFYYVCLRRSDGVVEGLYYDPQSSPYQCLRLESRRGCMGRGAWEFR